MAVEMRPGIGVSGYTVVDFETTGFSPSRGDRVVEIGVVKLDPAGNIIDSWETLINPYRHVGATHIHGIHASDVVGAPAFSDVADLLAAQLSQSVFVAHNASFDANFAQAELSFADRLNGPSIPFLDTMQLCRQTLRLPNFKLVDVCAAVGIENQKAHCALSDALATAQLLQFLLKQSSARSLPVWSQAIADSMKYVGYQFDHSRISRTPLLSRDAVAKTKESLKSGGWIFNAIGGRAIPDDTQAAEYFRILDAALLDQHLSYSEQNELLGFARHHDLSTEALARLHVDYILSLVKTAEADGAITEPEKNVIEGVAELLGVPVEFEQSDGPELSDELAQVNNLSRTIKLAAGDRVAVTGPIHESRDYWEGFFESHGVKVAGIAKATRVLIAGDPDSMSSKAKKARDYGIPIIAEEMVRTVIEFS